ncbi:MAG TPA: sugar phosphate isomerase/epimerase [Candidatus Deferrimicrobium sp.]|nr:sugar phosphate isomerase/epimerase [Candidatus Deferrimicrobium sp.]
MNKIGIHALVWAGSWGARECEYTVASSKEAGYDLVEFPVFQPAAMDIEAIQRALSANGMTTTCSLGLSFDKDINSEDAACVARGEALLHDALMAARDLGSPYLGGVIFSALGPYSEMPTERSRQNSIAAIRRLAEKAAPLGITIGLEFVNRYESNLLNTTAQTVDFIAEVGLPNVVVHADSYHMNIEENDFRTPIVAAGDKIGYVHIGENHRGYLGSGHVNFPQLFAALVEIGYKGTITFESFSSAVVDEDLSTILRIWRNVWTDGMDLAKQARGYIAAQMEAAAQG